MSVNKNLYIIGFSGTGKTSVIELLESAGYSAFDSDSIIEQQTGLSIREIFEMKGEAEFRKLESKVINALALEKGKIVAFGGGAVLNEENLRTIKGSGKVLWLDASSNVIFERLKDDFTRPLLSGLSVSEIESIKVKREPLYRRLCDDVINTNELTIEDVFKKVKEYYESSNWTR